MLRLLHYALRQLQRSPGFTLAAVLSLTLGIGATTAMFTLTDALLFRPLPVREPDRLVQIGGLDAQGRERGLPASLLDLLRREGLFEEVCGFTPIALTVEMEGEIVSWSALPMTGGCFKTLGVTPALGRMLEPADDTPGAESVAVLTYDTWQRDFGGRTDVLGQEVTIEGYAATIVGVTQRGFSGIILGFPARLIYPVALTRQYVQAVDPASDPSTFRTEVLARLKHEHSIAQVTARLEAIWPQLLEASVPPAYDAPARERYLREQLSVTPASTGVDYLLRDKFGHPLVALLGIAIVVLLVSCVNVANLLLARAAARRRELSIRLALGAGRWTLMRDALAESLLLLVASIGAGVTLAYWGNGLLVAVLGAAYPDFAIEVTPDARMLSFACAVAVAAFLLFAVGPALRSSRTDATAVLSASSSRVMGDRSRLRPALVVIQIALTLTLVTGAVLFATALAQLRAVPLGLATERVLEMQLMPLPGAYQDDFSGGVYYQELLERVARVPGVRALALGKFPSFAFPPRFEPVTAAGAPEGQVQAEAAIVTDGFLTTMGIPLVAGEDFRRGETSSDARTVIVSQSLARKLFGARDPLGQHIRVGHDAAGDPLEIIGVARDAVLSAPRASNTLMVYRSFWQAPAAPHQLYPMLQVRTDGDPGQIAGTVRGELKEAGREYPGRVRTLLEERDASLTEERLLASLSMTFGWLGLTLAAIGLYGLLAFSVARRTGEIGIRMALGAKRSHILRLVLREAFVLIAVGVLIGLPITVAGARAVRSLLYGVGPIDVAPLAASIGILVVVGALAACLPARRAASVAPSEALRHE